MSHKANDLYYESLHESCDEPGDGLLQVGDTVLWRGGWGRDIAKAAKVLRLELVREGEKYGVDVRMMPWDIVEQHAVVTLDNGHWAYGSQLEPYSPDWDTRHEPYMIDLVDDDELDAFLESGGDNE